MPGQFETFIEKVLDKIHLNKTKKDTRKKVFISVPMHGRTKEQINRSITTMKKLAVERFGKEIVFIDNFVNCAVPENSNKSLFYLSKSLEKLSKADYYIGVENTGVFNGCRIENDAAISYGIMCHFVDITQIW